MSDDRAPDFMGLSLAKDDIVSSFSWEPTGEYPEPTEPQIWLDPIYIGETARLTAEIVAANYNSDFEGGDDYNPAWGEASIIMKSGLAVKVKVLLEVVQP